MERTTSKRCATQRSIKARRVVQPSRAFLFDTIMLMELVPNTDNVVYIDEYPELAKRVWLRRLAQQRLSQVAVGNTTILPFERPEPPDGAA